MTTPPAPDPTGTQPDTWPDPKRWLAYQLVHQGHTLRDIGKRIGRSGGTVGRWVKQWEQQWPGIFDNVDRHQHRPTPARTRAADRATRPTPSPAANEQASNTARLAWADARREAAANCGDTANQVRTAASTLLTELLDDPARRAEVTPNDIYRLARAATLLYASAEILQDKADGHGTNGVPSRRPAGDVIDVGVVAGLEEPEPVRTVTGQMVTLLDEFRAHKAEAS